MATEDDSAWKNILDTHLESFMSFFFPEIHRDLDWRRSYETLDKELQVILRVSRSRKRLADKLVKVYLKGGRPVVRARGARRPSGAEEGEDAARRPMWGRSSSLTKRKPSSIHALQPSILQDAPRPQIR